MPKETIAVLRTEPNATDENQPTSVVGNRLTYGMQGSGFSVWGFRAVAFIAEK